MFYLRRRFYGAAEGKLYFPMAYYLTRGIRRRLADELRNKFAVGKLGQAAKSVLAFTLNKCSLPNYKLSYGRYSAFLFFSDQKSFSF